MKFFEVRFKKKINSKKPILVEAARWRKSDDRMWVEFLDESGAVIKRFPALDVSKVSTFADGDDPLHSVAS